MYKATHWAVATMIVVPSFSTSAASVCDLPQSSEQTRIYFANGFQNEESRRAKGQEIIEDMMGSSSSYDFGISINEDEDGPGSYHKELLEAYRQKSIESDTSRFWNWLSNVTLAPDWFKDVYYDRLQKLANEEYLNDADLKRMTDEYIFDMNSGKKVVILAHSQGNLYANSAYRYIASHYPEYRDSIGIVAVATPADRVQDGGDYTTNLHDVVIEGVRWAAVSGNINLPKTPNVAWNSPTDGSNHAFIETYMQKWNARIRKHVVDTVNHLEAPPLEDECKPGTVTTRGSSSISSNNASLSANVTSGKNIDVWFNVRKGANPASCSSTARTYDGQGSASQGQIIYGWANSYISLQPNAMYYFRACAKNDPGEVSQGAVRNFRTKNAVATRVTTHNASSITRSSATLNGSITAGNRIDTWFSRVSTTSNNASCTGNPDGMGSGDTGEKVSTTVSGLNFGTTYYYRFCGKGYDGLKSGTIRSFKTDVADTEVKTLSAKNVDETTATIRGEIVSGDNIEYWWVRSTDSSKTSCRSSTREGSGHGNGGEIKTLAISNLSGSTKYHYRFCGSGQDGTNDGRRKSFTTDEIIIVCGDSYQGSSEGLTVTLVKTNSKHNVVFASFEAYTIPDRLDIYYSNPGGSGHSSTGGFIAGHRNFQFPFNGRVKFYVTGNSDKNTLWNLNISCYNSNPF